MAAARLRRFGMLCTLIAAGPADAFDVVDADDTRPAAAAVPSAGASSVDVRRARHVELVLAVSVNGVDTGRLARFSRQQGRWFASATDLLSLGIPAGLVGSDAAASAGNDAPDIPLDTLPGVRVQYDATDQRIDLQLPDGWRTPWRIGGARPPAVEASAGRGVLLNYDGYLQRDRHTEVSVWTEARAFWSGGTLHQTGVASSTHARRGYRRYDTWWQHDNPATLTSWVVGDAITGSLAWTRSVRIGGVQWRRNFALRPDLVTFPVPALHGSAVVPSAVDVYLDGVRRYSTRVPAGPFVLQDAPGLTGDMQASVVTRDALGRERVTTVPLYIDPRLLAQGLWAFSVDAGLPRDAYGLDSLRYRPTPVASAVARHGWRNGVTVEAQAQAGRRLFNAGAGVLARLARLGVLSASAAASSGRGYGAQASLGYQYLSQRVSVDLQAIRATRRFRDLATLDGVPAPTASDRVTLSMPWGRARTLSLAYFGERQRRLPPAHVVSASVGLPAGPRGVLSVSAFRDLGPRGSHGLFAMLSVLLGGGALGSASVSRQGGQTQTFASATRTPEYGGGWGWQVLGGQAYGQRSAQAELDYLGRHGEVSLLAQSVGRHRRGSVGLTGALVAMDGAVHVTRQVYDAFALVSTGGTGGVPVLREYVPIGHTDARGYLLVPDLVGYTAARVGIDPTRLPADRSVPITSQEIAAQRGAGVLVRFPVTRYRAALVTLVDLQGRPLPAGHPVHHLPSGHTTVIGYDGQTFIEHLSERNTLEVQLDAQRCQARFDWQPPTDGTLARIGPIPCAPFGALASP